MLKRFYKKNYEYGKSSTINPNFRLLLEYVQVDIFLIKNILVLKVHDIVSKID